MKLFSALILFAGKLSKWFFSRPLAGKALCVALLLGLVWFGFSRLSGAKTQKEQYQIAQAEKATLVVSLTSSGTVSTVNSASVTTQAAGVVKKIFVTNGQTVRAGDPVIEIDPDLEGKQRASQAYASYQGAKNQLDNAKATLFSMRSSMFTQWKSFMDTAQNSTYQNADGTPNEEKRQLPQFISTDNDWLAAEAKFKTQENAVSQAQTALTAAWLSYQQSSPIVYAPITGTVSGLSLQIGSVLSSQTNTSGSSASQKIASIKTDALPTVTLNLTQVDVPKVKVGNKATLTFDAFPDKTFTGVVVSVDSIGQLNSGVTSYPAVIKLDSESSDIFPNMSVSASIITQTKDNVLLIPSGAVQSQNGEKSVRILKNGVVSSIPVETGLSSDTQVEILSGISEGETVITGITANGTSATTRTTQSPFSPFGARGFGGGVRVSR